MRTDLYTKIILTAIAILLAMAVSRPILDAPAVLAESNYSHLYVEPGTTILRTPDGRSQVQGKVMIDRRTGDVWGFPTQSSAPYPVLITTHEPPLSKPLYLGRFDFSAMKK